MKRKRRLPAGMTVRLMVAVGLIITVAFAIFGIVAQRFSQAASFAISQEAETGTRAGNATGISESSASGGRAVKFGSGPVVPPPGPNPPNPPGPDLLWYDAQEAPVGTQHYSGTGFKSWYPSSSGNVMGRGTVRMVADSVKGKAIEYAGASGSDNPYQRAELVPGLNMVGGPGDASMAIGQTYWFGFDFWAGQGIGNARNWQLVWQIKPHPSGTTSPHIELSMNAYGRTGLVMDLTNSNHSLGQVPVNQWTRFVIGVNITKGSDSWIEVWRDGQNVMQRRSVPNGAVKSEAIWAYMKTGIYRGPNQGWEVKTRQANFKIGTTKAIVE